MNRVKLITKMKLSTTKTILVLLRTRHMPSIAYYSLNPIKAYDIIQIGAVVCLAVEQ